MIMIIIYHDVKFCINNQTTLTPWK